MSVGAEYTLKQSKVHMSVDSNLLFKTTLDTELAQGTTMQACAEMLHIRDHYRFGLGLIIM